MKNNQQMMGRISDFSIKTESRGLYQHLFSSKHYFQTIEFSLSRFKNKPIDKPKKGRFNKINLQDWAVRIYDVKPVKHRFYEGLQSNLTVWGNEVIYGGSSGVLSIERFIEAYKDSRLFKIKSEAFSGMIASRFPWLTGQVRAFKKRRFVKHRLRPPCKQRFNTQDDDEEDLVAEIRATKRRFK